MSSHPYDGDALAIIDSLPDGLILDCGAGLRGDYLDNVVNFEICDYPTTDMRGVGEQLPFRSESFDAVFSFSVLEHVRRPFDSRERLAVCSNRADGSTPWCRFFSRSTPTRTTTTT